MAELSKKDDVLALPLKELFTFTGLFATDFFFAIEILSRVSHENTYFQLVMLCEISRKECVLKYNQLHITS